MFKADIFLMKHKKAKWGIYYYSNMFHQVNVQSRHFNELLRWWERIHQILDHSDSNSKQKNINPQKRYRNSVAIAFHINTYDQSSRAQRQRGTMKIMPGIDEMHLENAETQDGSTAKTLQEFIDYAYETAPAKNVIIILNGHGGSWSSFAPPKYRSPSDMNIVEVAKAMQGRKAKLLYLHSCDMSDIETHVELSKSAEYILASQFPMYYMLQNKPY